MSIVDANKVSGKIIDYFNDLAAQKLLDKKENQFKDLADIYEEVLEIINKAPSVDEEIYRCEKEAYQRGLKNAWTAAKKLVYLDYYEKESLKRLFDTDYLLVVINTSSPEKVMETLNSDERKLDLMKETLRDWKKEGFTRSDFEDLLDDLEEKNDGN